jgi:hypothetical protein
MDTAGVGVAFSSGGISPVFAGTSANGNPGNALEVEIDGSNQSFWGGRMRSRFLNTGGNSTADLSKLQVTFDIEVVGTSGGSANVDLVLNSFNSSFANTGSATGGVSVTEGSYQTFSVLASNLGGGGSLVGDDTFLTFEFRWNQGGFGFDAGNIVRVDNVAFEVIPEPSTYAAIFGALALGIVILRRRLRR